MFLLLDTTLSCSSTVLATILDMIQKTLGIIQIIVPILLIVGLAVAFSKMMLNPDEKKEPKKIANRIIAAFIIFILPFLLNIIMSAISEYSSFNTYNIGRCWTEVKANAVNLFNNIDTVTIYEDQSDEKIYIRDSEYEMSDSPSYIEEDDDEDNNSNNNNSTTTSSSTNSNVTSRIFIGDSRTVQLYCHLHGDWQNSTVSKLENQSISESNGDVWSAKGSMGLPWMKSSGIPHVQNKFTNGSAIIILMGVNDLDSISSYVNYLNTNVSTFTKDGAKVYFVSVMPCNGKYEYLNSKIIQFNDKIKSSVSGIKYIDAYTHLKNSGFNTTDGLHYDKSTSEKIYNYIKSNL